MHIIEHARKVATRTKQGATFVDAVQAEVDEAEATAGGYAAGNVYNWIMAKAAGVVGGMTEADAAIALDAGDYCVVEDSIKGWGGSDRWLALTTLACFIDEYGKGLAASFGITLQQITPR